MKLKKLDKRMKKLKMRPEDLASKTSLSMSTIKKARKEGDIKESTARLIALGMETTVEELL